MRSVEIISSITGLGTTAFIFYLLRRNLLYSRYTFWWLFVAVCFVVLGFFPGLSDWMARLAGISYGPIIILLGAIVLLFIKNLSMDIDRSHQEVRLRRLVQRMSLLQAELDELKAERDKDKSE